MGFQFHHYEANASADGTAATTPNDVRANEQRRILEAINFDDEFCVVGVVTWGSVTNTGRAGSPTSLSVVDIVMGSFHSSSKRFVKIFETDPPTESGGMLRYSCYVDPVRKICLLFMDGEQTCCDSRTTTKHELLISFATIFSVSHVVMHVQLSTRLDSTFEVLYKRIDRLRRSFTPLIKTLGASIFTPRVKRPRPHASGMHQPASAQSSAAASGVQVENLARQTSSKGGSVDTPDNGVARSASVGLLRKRTQDSDDDEELSEQITSERQSESTQEDLHSRVRPRNAYSSDEEDSDEDGISEESNQRVIRPRKARLDEKEPSRPIFTSDDEELSEDPSQRARTYSTVSESIDGLENETRTNWANEMEDDQPTQEENSTNPPPENYRHSEPLFPTPSNTAYIAPMPNLPTEVQNWSNYGRLVSPRLMFFVDVNYHDWKNSNNSKDILEQLEYAEQTFEQRVQTLAKKARLYTGQSPVGLFTLSSPKDNAYVSRYVYFEHSLTTHLRDFYQEYLKPHVELVQNKNGFPDAVSRCGKYFSAMPVATPSLKHWMKMTCALISSIQDTTSLKSEPIKEMVTNIKNTAARICDIEAQFNEMRAQKAIPQAVQRYTELLESKSAKVSREAHRKYLDEAKKYISAKVPGREAAAHAQFHVERMITQQFIQRAEQRTTWSSCGRQTGIRPIDEACSAEELTVFYRNLNSSILPAIKYTEMGNNFVLARLGDSSEFNLSSNTGLKITNQTGFISAGNYLVPWHFDETSKNSAKVLNVPGQRYRRSAKWGDIIYVGYEYETSTELRFFGYSQKNPVIKSRDGTIKETGEDLLCADRDIFLGLGKANSEREQTGQLTRIWLVIPENFQAKLRPAIQVDAFLIEPELQSLVLTEGTYSLHVPCLFPTVKASNGNPIPKAKIMQAALESKIRAVFRGNPIEMSTVEAGGNIYD